MTVVFHGVRTAQDWLPSDTEKGRWGVTRWRATAVQLLPELSAALDEAWSVHIFLWELHGLVTEAHRARDEDTLRRGYAFAAWCLLQPERFLTHAATVSFYEHVFDDWELRADVVPWLPDDIALHVRPLWEWRLPSEQLAELDRLLGAGSGRTSHVG